MPKYGLGAGRVITVDGRPHMMLVRAHDAPDEPYHPTAVEADAFASEVVAALNAAERRRTAVREADEALSSAKRLRADRMRAADAAFERHDFGSAMVGEASGWEAEERSNSFRRTVYLETEDGTPSTRIRFNVEFEGQTARVASAGTAA